MNSLSKKLIATVAVAAPLALSSPAHAAELFGSDLNAPNPSTVGCAASQCTIAQRYFDDWTSGSISATGVITEWKVKLVGGAQARLKTFDGDPWNGYTARHTGATVTGNGSVNTMSTRIPVEWGDYAGVELLSGQLRTDHNPQTTNQGMRFQGAFADGQKRQTDSDASGHELMSQVRVEPDADGDGYGDETQDPCVFCSSGGGGGEVLAPDGSGGGSSSSGDGGSSSGGQSGHGQDRPLMKLAIDKRGFFEYRNGKPYITLYLDNQGRRNLKGSIKLKYGKKALPELNRGANDGFEIDWDYQKSTSNFRLPKKLVRQIQRKGSATLTAEARMTAEGGGKTTTKQAVKVRRSGLTNAYDGYYKGTGGLTMRVSGGFLISINVGLNAYCQRDRRFMPRSLYTLDGYPLMIGRNGKFAAKGSNSPDTVRYEGRLTRKGTGKGYLSLFHTKLGLGDGGRLNIDQCFAASNWTVKKVGK